MRPAQYCWPPSGSNPPDRPACPARGSALGPRCATRTVRSRNRGRPAVPHCVKPRSRVSPGRHHFTGLRSRSRMTTPPQPAPIEWRRTASLRWLQRAPSAALSRAPWHSSACARHGIAIIAIRRHTPRTNTSHQSSPNLDSTPFKPRTHIPDDVLSTTALPGHSRTAMRTNELQSSS